MESEPQTAAITSEPAQSSTQFKSLAVRQLSNTRAIGISSPAEVNPPTVYV